MSWTPTHPGLIDDLEQGHYFIAVHLDDGTDLDAAAGFEDRAARSVVRARRSAPKTMWLNTIKEMNMLKTYFTHDQLERLAARKRAIIQDQVERDQKTVERLFAESVRVRYCHRAPPRVRPRMIRAST
jgi:hypothetical protein